MSVLPFDRVVLHDTRGLRVELSVAEFWAQPLHDRVAQVLRRDIVFLMGMTPIDRRAALRALREATDVGHAKSA